MSKDFDKLLKTSKLDLFLYLSFLDIWHWKILGIGDPSHIYEHLDEYLDEHLDNLSDEPAGDPLIEHLVEHIAEHFI